MKTQNLKDLVRELSSIMEENRSVIIGIDGVDGSGKSTLAASISNHIAAQVINLDDYVEKHKGKYISKVDFETLQDTIKQYLSVQVPAIIIEGVCLLSVLEQMKIKPDKAIYVKRIGNYGFWMDDKLCNPEIPLEEIMRFIDRAENVPGIGNLDREIAIYHREYYPQEKADFIFERVETSSV